MLTLPIVHGSGKCSHGLETLFLPNDSVKTGCTCVLSQFSYCWLCATLWTISGRLLCPWGFSRHKYWSGLPCPSPGDLPDLGIKPMSLMFPALAGRFFTTSTPGKPPGQVSRPPVNRYHLCLHKSCTTCVLLTRATIKATSMTANHPSHMKCRKKAISYLPYHFGNAANPCTNYCFPFALSRD